MQNITCLKKCILFLLFLFLYGLCNSQAYKYRFRTISLPEEFKNQHISIVDEDAAGMLWFVTTSGLHRYDGNKVLSFDMQSTPALPDAEIGLLVADSRNHVWIGTLGKLVYFDLKQWSIREVPFQHPPATLRDSTLTALAEGKDSTVYAAFSNNLYRVAHDSLEYITHIDKHVSDTVDKLDIIKIREPLPGHLILTTSLGKLVTLRHRQNAFGRPVYVELQQTAKAPAAFSMGSPSCKYLLNVPGRGPYDVDMKRGLATPVIDLQGIQIIKSYSQVDVTDLEDSQAIFFYKNHEARETGLVIYNAEHNTVDDLTNVYPAGLKYNQLRSIRYKNGHILIPIKGGIATVSNTSKAFDVFDASMENANSIRSIYKEPGGHLLIGSYLHPFYQFDEASSTSINRSEGMVTCMLPWHKDTLLVSKNGLNWHLPATNQLVTLYGFTSMLVSPFINCLTRETDTSVWVGSITGFYLINPYTRHTLQSGVPEGGQRSQQSGVYDILKVGTSRFFATRKGLFKYNVLTKSWTKLLTSAGGNYASSYFTCLRLVNNQVWAGTVGNGMLVLDTAGNLLRKISTAEGLAGNIIFSNPLCKNYLFVGTRTGLSIINLQSGKISNYSSEYYLPANEFNRSAWYVNGDTVYMGTINGFIRIDIKRLQHQQAEAAPGICFSSLTYSTGSTSQSDYTLPYRKNIPLTIPPEASNFSISFGAISEMATGLKLYYRLSADGPWQEIGQRREITFVNIAPDNYTMQIAARMPDGRWMENILTLPITVQPHFYQTWWWKGLLLVAALGLIWLGIKYREQNILKEQKLRSRIAGDLHDEVGSALTRIYFQAGMLTTVDEKAAPPTAALQQIASSSQEALSSMSDMVWSIEANHDNAPDMVDRIRDYIARLQDELDCHCTFNVSGNYERLRLSQVVRQNILLILKEAMNNALKYGSNKTVAVQLSLNENMLLLEVMNKLAVTGIRENTVQGGHGMKSMQLRADKIKAKLSITRTSEEFMVQLQVKPF